MFDGDYGTQYSIKAVAVATGLSVETLRAWERRRTRRPTRRSS
ncbi:MAG: MerR family transcriptional regulator [Steroidobacteraceae bacterium]